MANSILEKVNIEKATKNVRKTAKTINKETMKVSEDFVEGAIEAGEQWTKVMAKAMKTGTVLFGKQQDLMLDVLEGLKGQSITGTKRFGKLIGFKSITKQVKKATKNAKAKVEETRQSVDEMYDKAVNIEIVKTVNETVGKVTENAKAKVAETRQSIDEVLDKAVKSNAAKTATKKVAKKVNKKVATAKKAKASKKSTKKVTDGALAKVAKEVIISKDNLKKVEGIGVKMEAILNEAGIITFKQLGNTKISTLREILAAAGPRYNMHKPTTWARQAKLAAAGKMKELKKLQAELKGGKVVKK